MNCLVTGGLGFIGSNLSHKLIELGHDVWIMDIDHGSPNYESLSQAGAKFHRFQLPDLGIAYSDDIRDRNQVDSLLSNVKMDVIFHMAALPRVQYSIDHPMESHETNVNGTLNLLESARKYDVERFIFCDSSAVYGDQKVFPTTEHAILNPMSPYALQKLMGSYYCSLYYQLYGMETISLRYFNVFGVRQPLESAYGAFIPKFINAYLNDKQPIIFGDGKQSRDFIYVTDVVDANIRAATTTNESCFGEAFNIGSGHSFSVLQVDEMIREMIGTKLMPVHGQAVIEPRGTCASTRKAQDMLSWKPQVMFEQGLTKTVEWFRSQNEAS